MSGSDRVPVPVVLDAERFLQATRRSLAPLEGTHIHLTAVRDHRDKVGLDGQLYVDWLRGLLAWLVAEMNLPAPMKILDVGCGTGELTVLMNKLGHEAWGVDLHQEHLELARILAADNGVPPTRFKESAGPVLPFEDRSMDVAELLVVLEHVPDSVLPTLLGELRRVVRHGVHLVVPNRLQWVDDHTGLVGVPLLPRSLAEKYVRLRGARRAYGLSADASWDVWYRSFARIRNLAGRAGFEVVFPPKSTVFPAADSDAQLPLHEFDRRSSRFSRKILWGGLGGAIRAWAAVRRVPPEGLMPYLNLYLVRKDFLPFDREIDRPV